jgi:hypothetical protein
MLLNHLLRKPFTFSVLNQSNEKNDLFFLHLKIFTTSN